MRTTFEFVLPRGYVDDSGTLHKKGTMRLATARDELQPLRDPTITGPDDPRLTLLVLTRVVETLGTLSWVTVDTIEGLFAADLAYLQDFYGVINFGTDADIEALLAAQKAAQGPVTGADDAGSAPAQTPAADPQVSVPPGASDTSTPPEAGLGVTPAQQGRRAAIHEVPSSLR